MNKILILLCLLLSGCEADINPDYIKQLQNQCLKNGGVKSITTMNMDAAVYFNCVDGAVFTVYNKGTKNDI